MWGVGVEKMAGIIAGMNYFGETISVVINTVLLLFAYVVGVGMSFLSIRLTKKQPLDLNIRKKSYWSKLNLKKSIDEYYRQF